MDTNPTIPGPTSTQEEFARALGSAMADAAGAKEAIRGTSTAIKLLEQEARHQEERRNEDKEIFASLVRGLDSRVQTLTTTVTAAVTMASQRRETSHLMAVLAVVLTLCGVVMAGAAVFVTKAVIEQSARDQVDR